MKKLQSKKRSAMYHRYISHTSGDPTTSGYIKIEYRLSLFIFLSMILQIAFHIRQMRLKKGAF